MLVGIPGSGKTTLAVKLKEKGFLPIDLDSIRAELYGKAIEQGDSQKVVGIFLERLGAILATGVDIVIDNTNLKFDHRKVIIDLAKKYTYEDIQLWILDVPLAVCLERNSKRERQVNEDVVAHMHSEFKRAGRPQATEGKIVIVRPGKTENDEMQFFFPSAG